MQLWKCLQFQKANANPNLQHAPTLLASWFRRLRLASLPGKGVGNTLDFLVQKSSSQQTTEFPGIWFGNFGQPLARRGLSGQRNVGAAAKAAYATFTA